MIRSTCRSNVCPAISSTTARFLSSSTQQQNGVESVGRFKAALEDYRSKNYTQTIPPRFKKEITSVIHNNSTRRHSSSLAEPQPIMLSSVEHQKKIAVEDIERFLENIGALGENKVTHEDVETIVSETP